MPDIKGETTQLMTMLPTLPQLTESTPMPTMAKPTIAPTMVWVVDTGQPARDAINNHIPAAINEASMPNISNSGVCATLELSMIPFLIVEVT